MNEGKKGFECSADTEGYRVLQMIAGKVLHNTEAAAVVVGFSEYPSSNGNVTNVNMINRPGTVEVTGSGAIDSGADCYADDDGKVQALPAAAGSYRLIGVAIGSSSVDGDIFEIMPTSAATITVVT